MISTFKRAALLATLLLTVLAATAQKPRYIFYFIGDGMGHGHVTSAYQYNRMINGAETPLLMATFPSTGLVITNSASSPVTDSAAAGTALATGKKTFNGMLGVTPDSVAVASVANILHNAGYGVGIVTSVAADDATPGAFYAHQPTRKNTYEIGIEAAKSGYEFIAGSGLRSFVDKDGKDTGLYRSITSEGVEIVRSLDGVRDSKSRSVILLSPDSIMNWNIGYTIDSIPGALTLSAMTQVCLDRLEQLTPERFFMMVEGGNIDHAAHANDGGAVIKEVLNFDQAIALAYAFYRAHPEETLIVVTADHETGGMTLGNQYLHYDADLKLADSQRISKDRFSDQIKAMLKSRRSFTWEEMREFLEKNMGFWTVIPLDERATELLHESFVNTFVKLDGKEQQALYNRYPQFVSDVFDILNNFMGIGWTTTNHTGNPVPVFAVGAGSEMFSRTMDNTEIPGCILRAAGF